jgi:hypothetical protein
MLLLPTRREYVVPMELAGLTVPDAEVLLLARKLTAAGRLATADTLADAYACGADVVALTCADSRSSSTLRPRCASCTPSCFEEHLWREAVGL